MPEAEGATNKKDTSTQKGAPATPNPNKSNTEASAKAGSQTNAKETQHDYALLAAWRRLLDYDRVSSEEKADYKRIRSWVITLGFLTASLAVFSTVAVNNDMGFTVRPTLVLVLLIALAVLLFRFFIPELNKQRKQEKKMRQWFNLRLWIGGITILIALIGASLRLSDENLTNAIRIALVVLPIASVGLMNYASRFASSVTWVEYRVSSERIRSNIYQYRMRAGIYRDEDPQQRQQKLIKEVHEADKHIDKNNATLAYKQTMQSDAELVKTIKARIYENKDSDYNVKEGDGLAPMTIDEYVAWRIKPQINWYIDRIKRDYDATRNNRIYALVVSGFGALLSAFGYGLEGLVAITTAMSVALSQRSDIFMFGATYGLFHVTSTKLQNKYHLWQLNTPQQKQNEENIRAFVEACEDIFEDERILWREQAIQKQQMAEQSLQNSISQQASTKTKDIFDEDAANFTASEAQPTNFLMPDETDLNITNGQNGNGQNGTTATSTSNAALPADVG
jgi:hypothetical protein